MSGGLVPHQGFAMIRILLFVMFAALLLTNPPVTARQADPEAAALGNALERPATGRIAGSGAHALGSHVPSRETRVRSESPARPGSLRWHSFLPGMFR
ncbi:MAG: hypothetical protein H0T88_10810 [Lysobacter sp.]|nr:hypothetical protein [Lysobacter sp.]